MSDSRRTYSPQDFLAKLQRNELEFLTPLTGIAGTPEDASNQILFGDDCASWAPIPTSLIESVEYLQIVRCVGHTHPLVAIRLHKPQSEEAQVFARLVSSENRKDKVKTLPAVTEFGGGSIGVRPRTGGAGGHFGSGDIWYAIVCPECMGIVELHLTRQLANYYASRHNVDHGHTSNIAVLPFP